MLHTSPCDSYSHYQEVKREREMDVLAIEAYNKLNGAINYYFAPEFGRMLAYALRDGWEEAEIICRSLGLNESHMACLINDEKWLTESTQPSFDEGDFYE